MTMIVGMKGDGYVYLVADSSVTTDERTSGPDKTTASGILIDNHLGQGWLGDGMWKLFDLGNEATATFTGFVSDGMNFVETARFSIEIGSSITEAIVRTVSSITPRKPFAALIAFNESDTPRLWQVHNLKNGELQAVEIPDNHCCVFPQSQQHLVKKISLDTRVEFGEGREFLACFLIQLQTLEIRYSFWSKHIGGIFSGAYWDGNRRNWQSDILYHHYDSRQTNDPYKNIVSFSSMVREGLWIVGSDNIIGTDETMGATRYHPSRIPPDSFKAKWGHFFSGYGDYARWDYLGMCDTSFDRAIAVEMRKHLDGAGVVLEPKGNRTIQRIRNDIEKIMRRTLPVDAPFAFTLYPMFPSDCQPPPGGYPRSWRDLDLSIEKLYSSCPEDLARLKIDELIRNDLMETKFHEEVQPQSS